ncbi:MAG TPA: PQQ-binding-like beta-propeller repeat protein, partial [Gammaproteobacteria bacterium]|nr:PQQ-binding-like beta-propeller repeat protein [Gammaproteobacteria bacterium]
LGFANGNLAKFSLREGQLIWTRPIATPEGAFAIQRMIDIDADPLVFQHTIYAATYQGNIASLDWTSGQSMWTHKISSYTGMAADQNTIYITDAQGYLWAFNAENGTVKWQQKQLAARILTGPAVLQNYVVVGDAQGYLHWLDKRDGHFVAREKIRPLYTAPVVQGDVVYIYTHNGYLSAYTLRN